MSERQFRLRLLSPARRDLVQIYATTIERFGEAARLRYRGLIETALGDLRADPHRNGVRTFEERYRLYPIRLSRARVSAKGGVINPRHLIAFRIEAETIVVLRVLHDAMDVAAQLGDVEEQ